MMRTIVAIGVAVALIASVAAGQETPAGQWRGVAETMHGPAPLAVTIAAGTSGLTGRYEMELSGQRIVGGLDRVDREGDSLRFVISIQTNGGRLAFEFDGALVGDSAGGDFAATMAGGGGGAGSWWLRRESSGGHPERGPRAATRPAASRPD